MQFIYNWSSEVYSQGKIFRLLSKYPRHLPLFITSDHGVHLTSEVLIIFRGRKIQPIFHLTWNESAKNFKRKSGLTKLVYVCNPWITYRRRFYGQIPSNRKGTIFFPHHNVPGVLTEGIDDESSVAYLNSLGTNYKPISVCLHMHDLNTSRHRFFIESGFNVVSAGNTSSVDFVDNFYKLIREAQFTISESWGSNVAYAVEYGIPTQVLERNITTVEENRPYQVEITPDSLHSVNLNLAHSLFSSPPSAISPEQLNFITKLLGIDFGTGTIKINFAIWISLLLIGPVWIIYIFPHEVFSILRNKIISMVKQLKSINVGGVH